MAGYPEIFVLRHGQTRWNREGRHQGRLDSALTDLGRAQATAQGVVLKEVLAGRVLPAFVSPSGRTRATAELALGQIGVEPMVDERLYEVDFGAWQGLLHEEVCAGWPEETAGDSTDLMWNFRAPQGESYADVAGRVTEFLAALTGPSVIVTHGMTSRVMRAIWLGLGEDGVNSVGGGQGNVYHLLGGAQRSFEGKVNASF